MRNFMWISIAAVAGTLAFAPSASAERVCKERCDGGTCVQKCVEHPDVTIERDHDRDHVVREHENRRPGVDLHVPGVGIEIGH
jgi:hypothetical protein